MCDKEEDEMLHVNTRHRDESDKTKTKQQRLNDISSSIDLSRLPDTKVLSFDHAGRVKIDSAHPNYKYWIKDEE